MKKTTKLTALLLAMLMSMSAFTACAESAVEEGTPAAETSAAVQEIETVPEETELSDEIPDTNLNGYEFRFYSMLWTDGVEAAHRIMYEEYTGDPVNDKLHESTLYIEDRFNCNLVLVEGGDAYHMGDNTANLITAGDNAFDVAVGHDGTMMNLTKQGMFYNLLDIKQFNFDKPWWLPSMELEFCGKMYIASSYLSFTNLHWTRALMVNKDYMRDINLEIPYDTVREGKWTLDRMIEMVENTSFDVDGNGRITDKDNIGFSTGCETTYCLQESLGLAPYAKAEDGTRVLNFDLERMDTAFSKIRALEATDDFLYKSDSAFTSEFFKNGNVMMVLGQIGDAYDIYRECDFSYGFLPTPKYDELQENYISGCTDLPWAVPKTVTPEQLDIIGAVVEATSCYNYKKVLPAYFEVAMKSRTADSPDDAEMLQIIADGRTIIFAFSYGLPFHSVFRDLLPFSSKEVTSYYQSKVSGAESDLAELIESFETMQ